MNSGIRLCNNVGAPVQSAPRTWDDSERSASLTPSLLIRRDGKHRLWGEDLNNVMRSGMSEPIAR